MNDHAGKRLDNLRVVFPGDKLASIEEFVPGPGSVIIGDLIVSTLVGGREADMSNRVVSVSSLKGTDYLLPKKGDTIIGFVDSAQTSAAQITIRAINETPSHKELGGLLSFRDDRRRKSNPIRTGDIIRARITSTKNSIYHLSLDCPNCGVLQTACSLCGGLVVALGKDRVKCRECGFVDERFLSDDFIKYSRDLVNA